MTPAAPGTPDRTEAGPPTHHAALSAYLRLLWNRAPALWPTAGDAGEPAAPHLSDAGLHLPPPPSCETGTSAARWLRAAAAHATAHLVYSAHAAQDPALQPLTRALVGLLEDARVEWLAARELPGLRRLWLGFHSADAHSGDDAVSLMARLARALLDPGYKDPSPWVAKGRQLFFVDGQGMAIALRQPRELRYAASLLGHDLGQMRLQFNHRTYRPLPDYRDDNRWLWQPDDSAAETARTVMADGLPQAATESADAVESPGTAALEGPDSAAPQLGTPAHCYPEWDRLIARHRLRWCTVFERPVAARHAVRAPLAKPSQRPLASEARGAGWLRRQPSGDELELQPAIEQAVVRRAGLAWHEDDRVWARRRRRREPAHVLVLLDISASTGQPAWPGGPSLLALGRQAVEQAVGMLQAAGDRCAVHGFSSDGRHHVVHWRVLDFGEPISEAALARLAALRSGLSTRLGAALRHGVARLMAQPARRRVLLLVSDGCAHDVDVHDHRYLTEDAWQAVRHARRQGVQVLGIDPGGKDGAPLRRLLSRQVCVLRSVHQVDQALRCIAR